MDKTRQEKLPPSKTDTSDGVKTIDRMSGPVAVQADERKQLGERLQAKRDATNVLQFPNGMPQRQTTVPYKADAPQLKDRKPMGQDGKVLPPLNDAQAAKSKSPKMFVGPSGKVVGTVDTQEGAGSDKKNDKAASPKLPLAEEVKQEGKPLDPKAKGQPKEDEKPKEAAEPKKDQPTQKPAQKDTASVKAATEPAKKAALDAKQKAKAPISKRTEPKETPAEGTKGNRRSATAKGKAKPDPNSPVAKVAQKGAKAAAKGKKGKQKGGEEDEKLAKELDKDPKKAALAAGADGEGDGDNKGAAEKGGGADNKGGGNEEIVIPAVVRGNFGEGAEPKLLKVNSEALKEFVPQAIVNRNPDGSAIVLAGNMSASSEEDLKGPESKPKRQDVPAADVTAIFADNRVRLNALLDDFEMQARALASELEGIKAGIAGQISAGAEAAKTAIADALAAEKAKLNDGYAAQKGAIRASGKRLKGETDSRAKALKDTVKQDADSARDIVTTEFDTSDAALVAMELDMAQKSTDAFMQAPLDLVAVADAKGILASEAAQKKAAYFDSFPIPEQSGVEEFFNGEAYEKNRHRARVDAAEQVGVAYVDQFAQKAQEQGQLVSGEGLMQFQDHIIESIRVNREAILARKDSALADIKAAEDNATTTITTNATETCKTIEAAVKSGIDTLYSQQTKAVEGIDMMAEAKSKAIDETATANVQNLELQTQSAIDAINAQINNTINEVSASNNPQADMISGQLQQVLASLRSGHADAMQLSLGGTDATITGVSQVATDTGKEIGDTVTVSVQGAQKVAGGQIAGLEAQYKAFDKGNTEIQKNASKGMKDSGDSGEYDIKSQFDLVKLDLEDGYKKLVGKFKENTDGFASNLDNELYNQDAEMEKKAQEAYDAVNPAWVDWVLSAIDIIVMIVVTAVICVALASGVGILGLLLIGAVAGAVGGMIKYGARVALTSEEASWKGLAHAAVDGAIDGAKIAASMIPGWGPLVQIGVGALAGGLKYGNDVLLGDKKFSWQGLGINVFMGGLDGAFSIIGNKAGGGMGKLAEKYMVKAIGGKAVGVIGKEAIGKFADDATQAFTDTLNGGLQNMLQMWADGKGLDFKNFTDKITLREFATNFATNKVSGWGTDKATGGIHGITGIKPVEMKPGMAGYDPKAHGDGAHTPDTKTPDVKKPDSKTPDAKKPDTKTPDVKQPEVKTPDAKKPDAKTPDVKQPEVKTPDTKKPVDKVPDAKKPDAKKPEVKTPDTKKPVDKEAGIKKPVDKDADVKKPVDKDADVKKPVDKDADVKKPVDKDADVKKPVDKDADVKKPVDKDADVKKPVDKDADSKKPTDKDADVKKPVDKDTDSKKPSAKNPDDIKNPSNKKPDGDKPESKKKGSNSGGTKGKDVYAEGKGKKKISADESKTHAKIKEHVDAGIPGLPAGTQIEHVGGDTFKMTVDGKTVTVKIEIAPDKGTFDAKGGGAHHGGDGGPAFHSDTIRNPDGSWSTTIVLHGDHDIRDVNKLAGHEFAEVAHIVDKESQKVKDGVYGDPPNNDKINEGVAGHSEASVFKDGGSLDPADLSAHDRGVISEASTLATEIGKLRDTQNKTTEQAELQQKLEKSLSAFLDAQGIKGGVMDPRLEIIIKEGNVGPAEAAWLRSLAYNKALADANGGSTLFTPEKIHHMLYPELSNNSEKKWKKAGVSGGHIEGDLKAQEGKNHANGYPEYHFDERGSTSVTIDGKNEPIKKFDQWKYFPDPADPNGGYYLKSDMPKTTFESPAHMIEFLSNTFDNNIKPGLVPPAPTPHPTNPGATLDVSNVPVSHTLPSGLVVEGYMTYTHSSGTWGLTTLYVKAGSF